MSSITIKIKKTHDKPMTVLLSVTQFNAANNRGHEAKVHKIEKSACEAKNEAKTTKSGHENPQWCGKTLENAKLSE